MQPPPSIPMDPAATSPPSFRFHHPCGLRVSRHLHESELPTWQEITSIPGTGNSTGYKLPSFSLDSHEVELILWFENGSLTLVRILLLDPLRYGTGWDDWTEERETLRASDSRTWLASLGYPTGTYPWGEVWAAYDAKSGAGTAGVRYHTTD